MMNIFITGGSGFLGRRIIERLHRESVQLSGLARSERSRKRLSERNVTPVQGSLQSIDQWRSALTHIDIVIHCAAPVEFWGPWQKYQSGIVDATQQLYKAAETAGVKRFIFISSESVLQDKQDLIDIDETVAYPETPNSYYGKAKKLAEQFILGQTGPMRGIIIRPTFIWGPGVKALETMVAKVQAGDFVWIDHGNSLIEMVHVDNVAEAVALACRNGSDKSIYYVTDDNPQPVKAFLTKLFKTQTVIPPEKNLPKALVQPLACLIELVWKILSLQSPPPLTRFDLAFVAMNRRYNIDKIKHELNYHPVVSEEEGLAAMTIKPTSDAD